MNQTVTAQQNAQEIGKLNMTAIGHLKRCYKLAHKFQNYEQLLHNKTLTFVNGSCEVTDLETNSTTLLNCARDVFEASCKKYSVVNKEYIIQKNAISLSGFYALLLGLPLIVLAFKILNRQFYLDRTLNKLKKKLQTAHQSGNNEVILDTLNQIIEICRQMGFEVETHEDQHTGTHNPSSVESSSQESFLEADQSTLSGSSGQPDSNSTLLVPVDHSSADESDVLVSTASSPAASGEVNSSDGELTDGSNKNDGVSVTVPVESKGEGSN